MPNWIKLTTGLVAAVLVIAIGAAVLAPMLIDRQQLLREFEAEISRALGRPTQIESISLLRLLPTPRVHLEGVQVSESVTEGSPILVTVRSVQLEAVVWPLVIGRLDLAEVLIDRPEVTLPLTSAAAPAATTGAGLGDSHYPSIPAARESRVRFGAVGVALPVGATATPSGHLAAASAESPAGALQQEQPAASGLVQPPALPPIRRLMIRDGKLSSSASPAATGPMFGLSDFSLTAGPIVPGRSGRVDATFTVGVDRSGWSMPGLAEAEIVVADPFTELALRPLQLRFGRSAGGQGPSVEIDAEALIDVITARVSFDPFELIADRLRVHGAAHLFPTPFGLGVDGQAAVPAFDLRSWLVEQAAITLPGNEASYRRVGGRFDLQLRGSDVAIDNAVLRLDQAQLLGVARLHLPQVPPDPFSGRLAVAVDRVDLDPYLTGASAGPATAAAVDAAPNALPPLPPLPSEAGPNEPGLRLDLAAAQLRAGGLGFGSVRLSGRLVQHSLELESSADFYGGWLQTQFGASQLNAAVLDPQAERARQAQLQSPIDTRLSGPELRLEATAGGVAVAALLSDLQLGVRQQTPPITGLAEIELDLVARGADAATITSTLGGKAAFAVRDGAVTMVDLGQLITGTIAAIGVSREDADNLTRFSALSLSAEGKQGRFESQDIELRSSLLDVDGVGQLDLPTQQISLDLEAVLTKPPTGRGIKELEGIPVPISAKGPWFDPRWEVDTRAALDNAARRALREDSGLFDKLEERTGIPGLGDGLRQILPGLLGR